MGATFPTPFISRRALLAGIGAATGLGPLSLGAGSARAASPEPAAGASPAAFMPFRIGAVQAISFSDGFGTFPLGMIATNADPAAVADLLTTNMVPVKRTEQGPMVDGHLNVLYLRIGDRQILVDAGIGSTHFFGPGTGPLLARMKATGIDPAGIDTVILTHVHPDHVGGLLSPEGRPNFPNAEIAISEQELAFWRQDKVPAIQTVPPEMAEATNTLSKRYLASLEGRIRPFAGAAEIAPGVHLVPAPGHTPGHAAVIVESDGRSLLHVSDALTNPFAAAAHPEWRFAFDFDGAQAVETRKKLVDRVATDGALVYAAHFPFPAVGRFRREGGRTAWQAMPWNWE